MKAADGAHDWLLCDRTRSAIQSLEPVLRAAIVTDDLQLRVMALELIDRGGKRLRPALVFLAAEFGSVGRSHLRAAAAAVELMHVASLYHDDVMDRATMRRHGASANARWGNQPAVLAGNFLFASAIALLASVGRAANRAASEASVELCTGQLMEVENAYNLDLSVEAHLGIVARKTATLFELPCRLGAELGGATPATASALAAYGRAVGVAFQLADDALDAVGEASELGKATGTDLREGVYGLPVLLALANARGGTAQELRALLERARLGAAEERAVRALVRDSGAVEATRELARAHAGKARAALAVLPDGAARRSLERLADHAVTRSG